VLSLLLTLLLLFVLRQHVHQIARHRVQHRHELYHRRLHRAEQPCVQLRLAWQRGEIADFGRRRCTALDDGGLDLQRRRGLDEIGQRLGERDRIGFCVGDAGGALEVLLERLEPRALDRAPGERVLDDLVLRLRGAQLPAQIGDLRDVQPLVVDQDRAVGSLERRFELLQLGFLVRPGDSH